MKARAEERAASGQCIICGAEKVKLRLGLCPKHHGRYKAELAKVSPENREDFEAKLIEAGMLLPNRKGQKLRPEDNEFAVFREKMLAEQLAADLVAGSTIPIQPVLSADEPAMGERLEPKGRSKKQAKRR